MPEYANTLIHRAPGGALETYESGSQLLAKAGSVVNLSAATVTLPQSSTTGAASATGNVATESDSRINKTLLTLTAVSVTLTDATTNGNEGSVKLYDFPAGNIHILGLVADLTTLAGVGGVTDTAALVGSFGSVAAAADATLTGTEANIAPSYAGTLSGGAGVLKNKSTGSVTLDGTSTAVDLLLNIAVPDAGSTANDTLAVSGTVAVYWINLGDN